jgi:RNA polymerase sigma-70 factor (ECF subfamily)
MVLGLAFRLGERYGADPRDIAQDAFLVAFTELDRLESPSLFGSWIGGITVRLARRAMKRHHLLARLGLERPADRDVFDRQLARSAPPDTVAELRRIYGRVDHLPEKSRTAFLLRRLEGMTLQEVSDVMGASMSSVKRWIRSAEIEALGSATGGADEGDSR